MAKYKPVNIPDRQTHSSKHTFTAGLSTWFVTTLWHQAKHLTPFDLPLCGLHIDEDIWDNATSPYSIVKQIRQVLAADLEYPIILSDKGYVMDGWHRIAKALYLNLPTIKAVRFEKTPDPDRYEEPR